MSARRVARSARRELNRGARPEDAGRRDRGRRRCPRVVRSRRSRLRRFVEADPTYSAQLSVHVGATRVVDLSVGALDADSLLPVYSSGKGATAIVIALLLERGSLDLDVPVASYWPEFAAGDKAAIPVRQVLSHQAGLPGVDGGFSWDELYDHEALASRLAAHRPFWRPGAGFMYHALTVGTLADELVRRIDGRPSRRSSATTSPVPAHRRLDGPARVRGRPGRRGAPADGRRAHRRSAATTRR